MKKTMTFALAMAALFLALQPAPAAAGCSRSSGGAILGTLGGAALGGFLGSKIGKGKGRLATTGAGVFLGGLLGNEIGRRLSCKDRRMAKRSTQHALETQPAGTQVAWHNPDSGHHGTTRPARTYQRYDGTYCREFQQTVTIGGETRQAYGTACRQPDGSWQIQS